MISLISMNDKVYVWNADDWQKIREDHRIVGALIGSLAHLPRQDSFLGLPVLLLSQEVTLLLELKVARLVSYPKLSKAPSNDVTQKFEEYRKSMYKEQVKCFQEERKRQVTSMIDRIVEGKRRKLQNRNIKKKKTDVENESSTQEETQSKNDEIDSEVVDRDALLKEELDKIKSIDESNMLVQTFTSNPWLNEDEAVPVEWSYPASAREKLLYKTFKDLWDKGHYLTSGQKFGADYLAYPGDPIKFHAQFLVVCIDNHEALSATDLVAFGRLGTSVRKTVALASLLDDGETVMYQSLQWKGT